ncbi:MAG: ImmA/IrrE family metallo-endopeptidase [Gemmatimonadaceae bacterium]
MAHGHPKDTPVGIRVIRSRADYDEMRRELDRLLDIDPPKGTPERDRIDVLLVLLSDYESRELAPPRVDPVDAIMFRMDQLGLKPRDLEPYLGGRSRVSEVLARKRPLSIAMIRALHDGLGIPAESLINPAAPPEDDPEGGEVAWERFPLREMVKRRWVSAVHATTWTREAARDVLEPFFAKTTTRRLAVAPLYPRPAHFRAAKGMDDFAVAAWIARVLAVAGDRPVRRKFDPRAFAPDQIRGLVQLSRLEEGPRLAGEWLADRGLIMVIEAHLPRTRFVGAAILADNGMPVIALTVRYDRLDNFWFTLLHECAHVVRHLIGKGSADVAEYLDDLDVDDAGDAREREADAFAQEALVPSAQWQASAVAFAPSVDAAVALADELGVSPAVIAGRVRHERRNFRLLSPLIGAGKVRRLFPEVYFD